MDSGSHYDQFSGHEAQPIEQKPVRERVAGQFANRAPNDNKYNNKTTPTHSSHYERKEQLNESKMAYWRLYTKQKPKGEFEQNVNKRFGGKSAIGTDYRGKMPGYIAMYKEMLEQWNNQ